MTHTVRTHLRIEVDQFDATIRRFIPGYETMISEAAGVVAASMPDLVLDLGAGTGALSAALLERSGVSRVVLVDVDSDMLERARDRLAAYGERASFTVGSFDDPLPDCDAVAASLALHHLPTLERKRAVFSRAFDAVRPGGVLVNADANMPTEPAERDRLYRLWADHMVRNGIEESRAWAHFDDWAAEDTYLPLDAELDSLAEVGFDPRCVWRLGPMSVVVARRPWT
jgi:tRNA (cmo5U34)-methyltransferase